MSKTKCFDESLEREFNRAFSRKSECTGWRFFMDMNGKEYTAILAVGDDGKATPCQKCEAILKAKGLWTDD